MIKFDNREQGHFAETKMITIFCTVAMAKQNVHAFPLSDIPYDIHVNIACFILLFCIISSRMGSETSENVYVTCVFK